MFKTRYQICIYLAVIHTLPRSEGSLLAVMPIPGTAEGSFLWMEGFHGDHGLDTSRCKEFTGSLYSYIIYIHVYGITAHQHRSIKPGSLVFTKVCTRYTIQEKCYILMISFGSLFHRWNGKCLSYLYVIIASPLDSNNYMEISVVLGNSYFPNREWWWW